MQNDDKLLELEKEVEVLKAELKALKKLTLRTDEFISNMFFGRSKDKPLETPKLRRGPADTYYLDCDANDNN